MESKERRGIRAALERARATRLSALGSSERRNRDRASEARAAAPPALSDIPVVPIDATLLEHNRILTSEAPRALGAAAYRMLRARLLQRARANDWRMIGVTSPGPGEGKSLTSINLALTIARERNNNVFLVDLDMRNPKIAHYLGATPPVEINALLAGQASAQQCLFSIGVENLLLAATRSSTDQSSELLASGRLEELVLYIKKIAPEPLIIADLPPLLSTDDALVVAPKVDAILLVVCEGMSRRDGAAKSLELLADFNLAGIVLNRSRAVVSDYYNS